MPKKKQEDKTHLEVPDYDKLSTIDAVENELEKYTKKLVGHDRLESQLKQEKKDFMSSINEQLREVTEEREHEIGVLSALEDRRRVLHAQSNVVPMPLPLPLPKPAVG